MRKKIMVNKLLNYYKKKYKLNIKLKYSYVEGGIGNYNLENKTITIDKDRIQQLSKKSFCTLTDVSLFTNNKQEIFNFVLLHELKHAKDFKNKINFILENEKLFDLRANKWAFKRYKKGIKYDK